MGRLRRCVRSTRSHDVAGWVLYPTRDETVAAIARHRQELSALFRVPTPGWDVIALADDKRNTYDVAERLEIPIPRSSAPGSIDAFDPVAEPGPWAIKPAIKERFIYETKKKAWRADDERTTARRLQACAEIVGPDEVIIQELIPGDGRHQVAFCALCDQGTDRRRDDGPSAPSASAGVRPRQHVRRERRPSRGRDVGAQVPSSDAVSRPGRGGVQTRPTGWALQAPRRQRADLGLSHAGCARRCRFSLPPVSIGDRTTGPFDARTSGSGLGPSPDGRSDRPR